MENRNGLSRLIVTKDNQDQIIEDPTKLEQALIKRNKKHFSQARNTPFAKPEITNIIQRTATNNAARKILDGTINVNKLQTTDSAKDILRYLSQNQQIEMSDTITIQEVIIRFAKWHKETSMSPVGMPPQNIQIFHRI